MFSSIGLVNINVSGKHAKKFPPIAEKETYILKSDYPFAD
jgi:hypothetical protein